MKITTFTRWRSAPSSRFRVRQYFPIMRKHGIEVRDFGLPDIRNRHKGMKPILGAYMGARRLWAASVSHQGDASLFSKEMLPGFYSFEPLARRPRILDVDDAIWIHRRGGGFVWRAAQVCDAVICGNSFLAERFRLYNENVYVLPTGVDTTRFLPDSSKESFNTIGWSGTEQGFPWLQSIEWALAEVLRRRPLARLRVLANAPPRFQTISPDRIEYIEWSPDVEISAIQGMTVGVMPLDDSERARGKCSYKMLLYMACGIPVVASPIGMNRDVLNHGAVGYSATSQSDWVNALLKMLDDSTNRKNMGTQACQVVRDRFDSKVIGGKLSDIIYSEVERL